MIICTKCGKENQDRYKFCLGCGAQLSAPEHINSKPSLPVNADALEAAAESVLESPGEPAAKPFAPVSPTPPAGLPKVPVELATTEPESTQREGTDPGTSGALGAAHSSPPVSAPPQMAACGSCGTSNPQEFVFCGNCGARLKQTGKSTSDLLSEQPPAPHGKLSLIKPDGSEGGTHPLTGLEITIGRGSGPLFDSDSYLSPRHLKLTFRDSQVGVEDAGSLNGVFMKLTADEFLQDGDVFRIGQELLRFDIIRMPQRLEDGTEVMGSPNPGYTGRLSIIVGPGIDGSAFPLMGDEIVLGRERGDILFSDDGYVSGTHAKIVLSDDGYYLRDLGSSNGTFIKIRQPRMVPSGTFILMGQQLFRIDYP